MYNIEILDENDKQLVLATFKYERDLKQWFDDFLSDVENLKKYNNKKMFAYFEINIEAGLIKPLPQYGTKIIDPAYLKFKNDKVKRRRGLLKR